MKRYRVRGKKGWFGEVTFFEVEVFASNLRFALTRAEELAKVSADELFTLTVEEVGESNG